MNAAPLVDPIRVETLTDRICKLVWDQGLRAITIIAGGLACQYSHEADPKHPGFIGVFDERAGTQDVREAVRFTLQRLQEAA